jgi:hypothetical protein
MKARLIKFVAVIICLALVGSILAIFTAPAEAAHQRGTGLQCYDRTEGVASLKNDAGKTLVVRGMDNDQNMVEVFMNPEDKTWTMTVSFPSNPAAICVFSSGGEMALSEPEPLKPAGMPM